MNHHDYVAFRSTVFLYASEVSKKSRDEEPISYAFMASDSLKMIADAFRGFVRIGVFSPKMFSLGESLSRSGISGPVRSTGPTLAILSDDEPARPEFDDADPKALLYVGVDPAARMPADEAVAVVSVDREPDGTSFRFSVLRAGSLSVALLSDAAIAVALLLGARKVYQTVMREHETVA